MKYLCQYEKHKQHKCILSNHLDGISFLIHGLVFGNILTVCYLVCFTLDMSLAWLGQKYKFSKGPCVLASCEVPSTSFKWFQNRSHIFEKFTLGDDTIETDRWMDGWSAMTIARLLLRCTKKTRAPRGTDRSPEYKERFCYKLDSRVKNETTEWNQKQQHFITHALAHCYEFGLLL